MSAPPLSVILPTLNAAGGLTAALQSVWATGSPVADAPGCDRLVREVLVVDGGSTDATRALAEAGGARVLLAPPGRGGQLGVGARAARGDWFLFLHADTRLDPGWRQAARDLMAAEAAGGPQRAGAFRFALDDGAPAARRLEWLVALRVAVFALPYGDQGLLISRPLYEAVGGFQDMPLFEDVNLVRRLGRRRLVSLTARAVTSADRFRSEGYLRRSWRNLRLLARYLAGDDPAVLARAYRRPVSEDGHTETGRG